MKNVLFEQLLQPMWRGVLTHLCTYLYSDGQTDLLEHGENFLKKRHTQIQNSFYYVLANACIALK